MSVNGINVSCKLKMNSKVKVFLFVLLFVCVFKVVKLHKCNLLINEINTDDPGTIEKQNYLEFVSFCDGVRRSVSLQNYYVIGISTGTANTKQMTIELVVDLWNIKTNDQGILAVCAPSVSNCDITIPNSVVHFRNEFAKNQRTLFNFMSTANNSIHAIAILYSTQSLSKDLILSQSKPFIKIDDRMKSIIKSNLVDMVVYSSKASHDNCEPFLDSYCDSQGIKYVEKEKDNDMERTDYTLNCCTIETGGFLPEKFKLGKPTPGAENDCTGNHFILEDHLINFTNTLQDYGFNMDHDDFNELIQFDDNTAQCSSKQATSQYFLSSIEKISRKMSEGKSDQCSSLDLNPDNTQIPIELNIKNERKRRISGTTDYSTDFEWETTKYFE